MDAAARIGSLSNLVGYVGAGALFVAYLCNQAGRLRSDDWRFPAINLLGSALIAVSLLYQMNPPSIVIELFWGAISLYGLWRCLRARLHARDV
jgi:hypothetical protein